MQPLEPWYRDRPFLVELFVFSNLAFLVIEVAIAHSVNAFRHPAEWVPVFFAAGGSIALLIGLLLRRRPGLSRWIGLVVGWLSVAVGVAGLIWHLESQFFVQTTLHNLVYSAPFAAPLSFAGLGFLLLLNRMVAHDTPEWGQWVLFLALGGFAGNFALSLADHAQNGFFNALEWLPVVSSALGIGFITVALFRPVVGGFLRACYGILALQILTGALGFGLHLLGDVRGPATLTANLLYGAPIFAPLLFADLALLAGIGLWERQASSPPESRMRD